MTSQPSEKALEQLQWFGKIELANLVICQVPRTYGKWNLFVSPMVWHLGLANVKKKAHINQQINCLFHRGLAARESHRDPSPGRATARPVAFPPPRASRLGVKFATRSLSLIWYIALVANIISYICFGRRSANIISIWYIALVVTSAWRSGKSLWSSRSGS